MALIQVKKLTQPAQMAAEIRKAAAAISQAKAEVNRANQIAMEVARKVPSGLYRLDGKVYCVGHADMKKGPVEEVELVEL
jgi:hypothetical protein